MNITKENIDNLNAVVKIDITEKDYQDKVDKILKDYRKNANIPGFRKGHVPMSLVKKQYEKPVVIDEVNKLVQESLSKYLVEEKLDILGHPIPKPKENFSWDVDSFSFEFELGLAPDFEVNLQPKKAILHYKIKADKKMIDEQIAYIREQYGKIVSQDEVKEDATVTGTFVNKENEIDKKSTFKVEKIKSKGNKKALMGKKVGDIVTFQTKGLFKEDYLLKSLLGITEEKDKDLDIEVSFTIDEISKTEPAKLDKELFDKVYGEDVVKTEKELREKIAKETEQDFVQKSDQQLLNEVTDSLIENTKFDLPKEFLQKWIAVAGEKVLSKEEAEKEYQNSEKGIRYQLIESKIIKDNNLQLTEEDLRNYAKDFIKRQMAQYGIQQHEDGELEKIANRVLSNQDEVKRLSNLLMSEKLLDFYKENTKLKVKEVTFEEFVKEVYK
ncbi:MAG: trigger factor [Flavobacteriales bacterium]|nr:MAG: trigger factor [Flavobacteriales bacterium]